MRKPTRRRTIMAGSPLKRSKLHVVYERVAELEEENRRLREQLGQSEHEYIPLYASAMGIPELEGMLDTAIVNAIITHRGAVYSVLRALDYPVREMSENQRRATMFDLLGRPGVRSALEAGVEHLDKLKDQIIAKQISSALEGDESTSLAASNFLARIGGWNAPAKVHVTGKVETSNVFTLLRDPRIADAIDKLDHEPGEAVAVQSEARSMLPPTTTYTAEEEE